MTKEELWRAALAEIEVSISKANFLTWFKNTALVTKKDGMVIVAVPNSFTKEWLENKYDRLVLRSIRNLANEVREVRFVIRSQTNELEKRSHKKDVDPVVFEGQLGFSEVEADRETSLNPRYTFDSYIVGSSNELAHAAALSVSKSLGTVYNPLFIYGGVGLGKTHLLQSIGNAVRADDPKKKIKYVSSERFTQELILAIKNKGVEGFKDVYRQVDLLIVDDVQFISGKEKTQEEFFHTFNSLYERNKQIVLSSDRPPKAIPTLEERLRSRFEGGMIADIVPPDYETRLAILKTKTSEKNYPLDDTILEHIASTFTTNIREIEGALNRVFASVRLSGASPSLEKVRSVLSAHNEKARIKLTPRTIIKAVSEFYDVREEALINKSRKREIVRPRQICMYLIRKELKSSYPFIGEHFGNRDHTTVMHACIKISKELQGNEILTEEMDLIRSRLYGQ